jgi:hypothetical protein
MVIERESPDKPYMVLAMDLGLNDAVKVMKDRIDEKNPDKEAVRLVDYVILV